MTSKYDTLADYLAAIRASEIRLTFAEIEAVIGPLPPTARRETTWWGTSFSARIGHAHAYAWWRAGYAADPPDFAAGTVTFRRVPPADLKMGRPVS